MARSHLPLAFRSQQSIPSAPLGPCGPGPPSLPLAPISPGGPAGPADPCAPIGPCGPNDPSGPVGPFGPAGPCEPLRLTCTSPFLHCERWISAPFESRQVTKLLVAGLADVGPAQSQITPSARLYLNLMLSVLSPSCDGGELDALASPGGRRSQGRCRPIQPAAGVATDRDDPACHAFACACHTAQEMSTVAASTMSRESYISRDTAPYLKCHLSYVATSVLTIAMPASMHARVHCALPSANFRAVCRAPCVDLAAGDARHRTSRKPLRALKSSGGSNAAARAAAICGPLLLAAAPESGFEVSSLARGGRVTGPGASDERSAA